MTAPHKSIPKPPGPHKPRLRFFENAANQQHIKGDDRYLYQQAAPRFRVAVIGTGTMGQEHMRVATLLGRAQIHGIFDTASHSMAVASQQFATYAQTPLLHYPDLVSACNDPATDALIICTPNFTHFEVLRTALQSGKPILLEKPMATRMQDAAQIVALAQEYGNVLQIGLQYRYKAQYVETLHELFARNTLGAVQTISLSEYRPPFLDKVGQWNKFNKFSGGTLVEKCCHYFDLINLIAAARPVSVYASGGQAVNFLDFAKDGIKSDIDDHAFVTIEYANGIRASFTLNMFSPDFHEELIVVGAQARLVATESFSILQPQPVTAHLSIELAEPGASRRCEVAYPRVIEQSGHHGATYFEHIAFMDQLEGIATDAATVEDGFWSMVVAAAAQLSMQEKRVVTIADFLGELKLAHFLKA